MLLRRGGCCGGGWEGEGPGAVALAAALAGLDAVEGPTCAAVSFEAEEAFAKVNTRRLFVRLKPMPPKVDPVPEEVVVVAVALVLLVAAVVAVPARLPPLLLLLLFAPLLLMLLPLPPQSAASTLRLLPLPLSMVPMLPPLVSFVSPMIVFLLLLNMTLTPVPPTLSPSPCPLTAPLTVPLTSPLAVPLTLPFPKTVFWFLILLRAAMSTLLLSPTALPPATLLPLPVVAPNLAGDTNLPPGPPAFFLPPLGLGPFVNRARRRV